MSVTVWAPVDGPDDDLNGAATVAAVGGSGQSRLPTLTGTTESDKNPQKGRRAGEHSGGGGQRSGDSAALAGVPSAPDLRHAARPADLGGRVRVSHLDPLRPALDLQ